MSFYHLSFTAASSLLVSESRLLIERFIVLGEWGLVAEEVIEQNLLQTRTLSSARRVGRELIKRLTQLSRYELEFFSKANYQDKLYLLWLAVCRCYKFLGQLAVEVLHERFVTLQMTFNYEDYNCFYDQKAALNDRLLNLRESTQKNLRLATFKILRDAELLNDNNIIMPAMMTKDLAKVITKKDANEFFYFPIFEADVARLLQ